MSEVVVEQGEVLIRQHGALRRITLNRPKALNAVTLTMAVTMTEWLRAWATDPTVGAVLLDGAGDRAFCAGGDIRAIYDAAKTGDPLPARFWATEYKLNVLIARYPKPLIAVMDGVVMGGGVGLSAHAAHRIVSDRSSVAMPEVGIGFFPDVGACFLLARAPGSIGTHLALTGDRVGAADAIYGRLADIHVPAARLADIAPALAECRGTDEVRASLGELATPPGGGRLAAARPWIDACYAAARIEDIVDRLSRRADAEARTAFATMRRASPTSLKITLQHLRAARSFNRVEDCFQQDYRIALACIAGHDFIEGVRATIIDKDRNPRWRPDTLEAVTADIVERHFKSVGALELKFEE